LGTAFQNTGFLQASAKLTVKYRPGRWNTGHLATLMAPFIAIFSRRNLVWKLWFIPNYLFGHTAQFSGRFVSCDSNMKIIGWTCNVLSVCGALSRQTCFMRGHSWLSQNIVKSSHYWADTSQALQVL